MSEEAYTHLDSLTKPVGALGLLEDWAARLRDLQHPSSPSVKSPALAVFCADHGVAHAKKVSQYPASLTPLIANELVRGGAGAAVIAESVGINASRRVVVDVGIIWHSATESEQIRGDQGHTPMIVPGPPVRPGTFDITEKPAMSIEECKAAEAVGARVVAELRASGSNCIALGEVGIGNTTPSSALLSAYTDQPPSKTCGPGTGLNASGVKHKIQVVQQALDLHSQVVQRQRESPREVLAALGGFEIAAIVGAILEADRGNIAVLVDGFICSVAALAAVRISPSCARCLFLATCSPESGHSICLEAIAERVWPGTQKPRYGTSTVPLNMGLRLGEGSGALLAVPILRAAADVFNNMSTLDNAVK